MMPMAMQVAAKASTRPGQSGGTLAPDGAAGRAEAAGSDDEVAGINCDFERRLKKGLGQRQVWNDGQSERKRARSRASAAGNSY
jgi:hypothetical protein